MAGLSLIYDGIVFINRWVVVDLSGGSASYDCGNKLINIYDWIVVDLSGGGVIYDWNGVYVCMARFSFIYGWIAVD